FAALGNRPRTAPNPQRVPEQAPPERLRRLHFALPINAKVTFSCATLWWYSKCQTTHRSANAFAPPKWWSDQRNSIRWFASEHKPRHLPESCILVSCARVPLLS